MKDFFNQAIADGLNELGYGVDVPNENGEMKFGPECHEVCTIAEKLNKLTESWPVIYGAFRNGKVTQTFGEVKGIGDTHKAKLAFIQEDTKPCEHQPSKITSFKLAVDVAGNEYYTHLSKCQYCGVEMQARWEAR